jgi:RecA-family ATPase
MDQIKPEKVDWLWIDRIPIGRLTLIDGDPAAGKSWLSLAVASAVSKGEALPFGQKPKSPAGVLLMSCEDGYSDTVRPRLDQLGADVSRIAIPNPGRGLATTMLNANFIEQAVKIQGPALVIVDPVVAFAGRKNTDKAGDVRELLSPLMGIAERYALACLIIRHFTKQVDVKAMYRGGGSVDFMAACRSAFIIVESEEPPNMRVLAQVKNSLGRKSPSLSFSIDDAGFRWGDQVDSDAEELLAAGRTEGRKKENVQLETAKQFLREVLSNGPAASNDVRTRADKAGVAWRTVWRAKEKLSIKATKERGTGEWLWRLP